MAVSDDPARPPTEAQVASTERLPADASWVTAYGSPSLGPELFAVATSGARVYLGGGFTYAMAGTAPGAYQRVAAWDGSGWHPMGDGVDAAVHAIAVVGTDVYVGGELTIASGVAAAHLARWDGTTWSDVAGGVGDPDRPYGTMVRALASDGATLYVGGTFTRAGDVAVRSLAALDLATGTWSDAGGGVGLSWSADPGAVHALALDGGSLYVGGSFDVAGGATAPAFARLDLATGTWTTYGTGFTDDGLTGHVNAIAVDPRSGAVLVGGRFAAVDDVRCWNLAVLRGERFEPIGDVSSYGGKYAEVLSVAVAGDAMFVGGNFTAVGNVEASCWARHDGTVWSVPGDGVESVVRAMAPTDDGGLVVVGDFTTSGALRLVGGGVWTGAGWRTFGQGVTSDPYGGGTVNAVVPDGAGAVVAGLFDQAGQLPVRSIARWTGDGWDAMAGGVTAPISHGQVFALARIGTDLYVAGRFAGAGEVAANNIARWDGQRWSALGDGLDGVGYALAVLGGRLYVGGGFTLAGTVPAGKLACWDPVGATWSQVGGNPTYDDDIRALAVIGDRWLVVGGDFHRFFHAGRVIVEGLWGMALFDTGREPTDEVLSGYRHLEGTSRYGGTGMVNALQVIDGDLFVGGWFDVAGLRTVGPDPSPGFPASNLAVWHFAGDGTWAAVGGGADQQVHALADVDGALAVGGRFSTVGGQPAARVALRDLRTGTWTPLGSGLGDGAGGFSWALALAQSPDAGLWVGGQFPVAGARPSANLARWTATRR